MSHRNPPDDPAFDPSWDEMDSEDDGFADLPVKSIESDLSGSDDVEGSRGDHLATTNPTTSESGQHLAAEFPDEGPPSDEEADSDTPSIASEDEPDREQEPTEEMEAEPISEEEPSESVEDANGESVDGDDDVDLTDFERMSIDRYTNEEYVAATTQEYQGLAEEMDKANEEEYERQAVAATMAGLESGMLGFDDVTGETSRSGEEVEREEQEKASDLTVRVATALLLVGLFLGSLALGGWAFAAFIILVMVVALGEFYATVRRGGYRPMALFGLLGVVGAGVGAQVAGPFSVAAAVVLTTVATILFYTLTGRRHATENMSVTLVGAAWISLFSFGISLTAAPNPFATVFFVAVVTAAFDIGGYFVGRSVGSRPMAPRISPNKTIEGYLGSVVAAVVVASILSTLPFNENIGFVGALGFAVVVAVLAPLGDLAESVIKRSLGVKDMGSVLPGHGGMLDRIDSFLFVVPGAYVYLRLLDLV
ncbi:MAG: hypothetical protein GEU79_06220 [Acidimicrobiia bacterium]|nr:hypothetical protein [Acidimicrobiia bacterium]